MNNKYMLNLYHNFCNRSLNTRVTVHLGQWTLPELLAAHSYFLLDWPPVWRQDSPETMTPLLPSLALSIAWVDEASCMLWATHQKGPGSKALRQPTGRCTLPASMWLGKSLPSPVLRWLWAQLTPWLEPVGDPDPETQLSCTWIPGL